MKILDPLLDFCIDRKKDVHLIGQLEMPLRRRLEAEKFKIFTTLDEIKEHRLHFTEPVAYWTEEEIPSDFLYKIQLPKPTEKPWCYKWCLESEMPSYIETDREKALNAESDSTCFFCKKQEYFVCKYDSCTEILINLMTGAIEDIDTAGHDYTDCRKRCQIEKATNGAMKPCADGETIYEKAGWTFETETEPATFHGRLIQ